MDQAAIDAHLADRRRIVAAKGAGRLQELCRVASPASVASSGTALEAELHRLVGTLGTFGMPEQSVFARRLLVGLREGTLAGPGVCDAVHELIRQLEEVS